jgi:hypothetical protein
MLGTIWMLFTVWLEGTFLQCEGKWSDGQGIITHSPKVTKHKTTFSQSVLGGVPTL